MLTLPFLVKEDYLDTLGYGEVFVQPQKGWGDGSIAKVLSMQT